jgi:hypothetical protein
VAQGKICDLEALAAQDTKPNLDLIEPRGVGGSENELSIKVFLPESDTAGPNFATALIGKKWGVVTNSQFVLRDRGVTLYAHTADNYTTLPNR